jgi:uncharacterized protein YodC (DUF2158 family)
MPAGGSAMRCCTWFNRMGYERIFAAADFHDECAELL